MEDKILQSAVVSVMNAIYESDFLGFSYGFRPGRGAHDAFDALAVGITDRKVMAAKRVSDAMLMAIWRRRPTDDLLHHSDRSSQYTSEQFQDLLAEHGIVCSMSCSGNCWDNAAMESFFSTLKTERCSRKVYRTRDAARADVFDYIERFYNSPLEYEQQRRSG